MLQIIYQKNSPCFQCRTEFSDSTKLAFSLIVQNVFYKGKRGGCNTNVYFWAVIPVATKEKKTLDRGKRSYCRPLRARQFFLTSAISMFKALHSNITTYNHPSINWKHKMLSKVNTPSFLNCSFNLRVGTLPMATVMATNLFNILPQETKRTF